MTRLMEGGSGAVKAIASSWPDFEYLTVRMLRSPEALVIGHAEWALLSLCGAVWFWWPCGFIAFAVALRVAWAVGNDTWDELSPSEAPEQKPETGGGR